MDRNNRILKVLFTSVALLILVNCFNDKKKDDDNIYDSAINYLDLSNAKGKYYFIPNKYEYLDEYKLFNLKKGDTLFLEIKKDSSFVFNYFYYNKQNGNIQLSKIENYKGKVNQSNNTIQKNRIQIPFPDGTFNSQGFLASEKDTIFYYRISMENYRNYEYRLMFKKIK